MTQILEETERTHKCRVFKTSEHFFPWYTYCLTYSCDNHDRYIQSDNWEEAILEALHHRMRNGFSNSLGN